MFGLTMKLAKALTCLAILGGAVLITAAPALAGPAALVSTSGWVGSYSLNYAACSSTSGITVRLPRVWAVNATAGNDRQWVRVRASLFVQNSAGGWNQLTTKEEWGIADDSSDVYYTTTNYTFISLDTPYHGTYRVFEDITWYPSSTIAYGGSLGAVLNMAFAPSPDCRV